MRFVILKQINLVFGTWNFEKKRSEPRNPSSFTFYKQSKIVKLFSISEDLKMKLR